MRVAPDESRDADDYVHDLEPSNTTLDALANAQPERAVLQLQFVFMAAHPAGGVLNLAD